MSRALPNAVFSARESSWRAGGLEAQVQIPVAGLNLVLRHLRARHVKVRHSSGKVQARARASGTQRTAKALHAVQVVVHAEKLQLQQLVPPHSLNTCTEKRGGVCACVLVCVCVCVLMCVCAISCVFMCSCIFMCSCVCVRMREEVMNQ